MFGPWTPFVALVAALLPLLWVKRWITQLLQELSMRWVGDPVVAVSLYFAIVLPGVLIHELSHWLAATLLGVPVRKFSLGPVLKGRSNRVSLGSVQVANADPLRASLIGLAPLLGGTLAILLVGYLVLDIDALAGALAGPGAAGQQAAGLETAWRQLLSVADLWLWLYLVFAVSNAMLPSESDMAAVRPVLIFVGLLALLVLIVSGVPAIPQDVVDWVSALAGYLASAFGLTLAVDLVFMLAIGLLLWPTRRLQGR